MTQAINQEDTSLEKFLIFGWRPIAYRLVWRARIAPERANPIRPWSEDNLCSRLKNGIDDARGGFTISIWVDSLGHGRIRMRVIQ
jgi:hypothetical protein